MTRRLAILVMAVFLAAPPAASASLPDELRSDLLASGVPVPQVTVDVVPPADSPITEDSTAVTFGELRPFLSPDPADPLPVPLVTMNVPRGEELSGIVPTPGIDERPTDLEAYLVEWRLAAYEAVKHAIASGEELAGVEIAISFADTGEEYGRWLIAAPDTSVYPPANLPASMSPEQVATRVRAALPAWAQVADLNVEEDYADERVIRVELAAPVAVFEAVNVVGVAEALERAQGELNPEGANIGRTIMRVLDPATGDPLLVAASDASFGTRTAWLSPRVMAFAHGPGDVRDTAGARRRVDDLVGAASELTGSPSGE